MKKYIICFLVVLCAAGISFGYYMGYDRLRLTKEEQKYIEENTPVVSSEDTTKTSTRLIMETYNEKDRSTSKEILTMPPAYLGVTRVEMIDKLNKYMEDIPLEELEKGLISYDLLYFSTDYVMLRKTYNPSDDFQKYYIKLERGCVTVYYSDKETVYEYTDINLADLPEDVRIKVINGMPIKDEKALYDFLENYSS